MHKNYDTTENSNTKNSTIKKIILVDEHNTVLLEEHCWSSRGRQGAKQSLVKLAFN